MGIRLTKAEAGVPRHAKQVAPNTWTWNEGGKRITRFHRTDILIEEHNTWRLVLTITSGGWRSHTTKERLCEALRPHGLSVYQSKGVWWLYRLVAGAKATERVRFYDGMVVRMGLPLLGSKTRAAQEDNLRERIKRFTRRIVVEGPPKLEAGDCWLCGLFQSDDMECVKNHVKENYLHGSLIVRALRAMGWPDAGISLRYKWATEPDPHTGKPSQSARQDIARTVRRFLYRVHGLVY